MYYQQDRINIAIYDDEKAYTETIANAEADGMIIPELDSKYDYRIYQKNKDGSHRRHTLVADHGAICDEGGEDWQPGNEAFNDLAELCRRKEARQQKIIDDAKATLEAKVERLKLV